MNYVDTNVIIAYIDVKDPNHKKSQETAGEIEEKSYE